MATGLTFPTLSPTTSPYQLVETLNDFFLQVQTASTFNFDTFTSSGSFDGVNLTLTNNQGGTFNVPWTDDIFATGGSYNNSTSIITVSNNSGETFDISLTALTAQIGSLESNEGNDFVTGSTFNNSTGIITFTKQSGGTFTSDLSTLTNDLYSLSSVTSFDVTTGATFSQPENEFTFSTFSGGSYSVNAGLLSANTFSNALTLNGDVLEIDLSDSSQLTTSLSGLAHNDYVVSGSYSSGSSLLSLTTLSGDTVNIDMGELANQAVGDDYIVSGEFNSGTSVMTLTTLSGNTVEVTGVMQEDRHIFSGNVVGTSLISFYGVGGYNFVVDVTSLSSAAQRISGGAYSADSSSIVFSASSGGTAFVVEGITTTTGGTYSSLNEELGLYNSTGGTILITGVTDNYITGATFDESSFNIDLTDRRGNSVSLSLGSLTADTGVSSVQGGTNISTGGTQEFPSINLNNTVSIGTVNAGVGNITTVNALTLAAATLNAYVSINTNSLAAIAVDAQTIDASLLTSTTINAGTIYADTVNADTISTSLLTSTTINADTVNAQEIDTNVLTAGTLNTSNGNFISLISGTGNFVSLLTAATFNSPAITSVTITADTINADTITATTISGSSLVYAPSVYATKVIVSATSTNTMNAVSLSADTIFSGSTDLYDIFQSEPSTLQDIVTNGNIIYSGSPSLSGESLHFYAEGESDKFSFQAIDDTNFVISGTAANTSIIKFDGKDFKFESTQSAGTYVGLSVAGGGHPYLIGFNGTHNSSILLDDITDDRQWKMPDEGGVVEVKGGAPEIMDFASTVTFNALEGKNFEITLTADTQFTIIRLMAGDTIRIVTKQDAVGSWEVTSLIANSLVQGGGSGDITLTSAANAVDIFEVYYDGTNYFWTPMLNYT